VLQDALKKEQHAARRAEAQARELSVAAMVDGGGGGSRGGEDLAVGAVGSPSVASIAAECSKRMRDAWAQNETLMRALEREKDRTSELQDLVRQLQA
jgi:hypothetical protein